ncbi:MAG: hypothetical protein AAB737_02270 [Patescibacteria group bacterium]
MKRGAGQAGAVTVSLKVVVRTIAPAVPVTVITVEAIGVAADVEMVIVEEQFGLQEVGEKTAVAPAGRPETLKETDCVAPEARVEVIVLGMEEPFSTETSPPFEREKLKEGGVTPESALAQPSTYPVPVFTFG